MTKPKEKGKGESSGKVPTAAKASSGKVPTAAKASSSKVPAASSGKMPAASSGKMPAASASKLPAASSSKMPAAKAASSSKMPAARPSGATEERLSGKMKAARPVDGSTVKRGKAAEPEPEEVETEEGEEELGEDGQPKRAMGLRGAAPWAARHAAKHAAEARKRAAEPPPPGSARATIRTPDGVEGMKTRIAELHNHVERMKTLRKTINKSFYDIGLILRDIHDQRLFTGKGFQNFESFIEREVEQLGKAQALRLVRMVAVFSREKAMGLGYDGAMDALAQLEGVDSPQTISDSKLPLSKPSMPTSVTRGPIVGR
ncbi:MAG: hypothetical protein EOO75_12095 [Myxococcales bacterium]|nr:MAG: hypothetical protein EOO75_12095 [Myxococcales bacterium]